MDETQPSRTSDAAATRKRRSSILKSQRPPRTPFSELEFTVATPTDTAKSRRVSFSRRTGVAEFVTNEATTTWKNFYEEHNKSLESSGNESGANHPPRAPVGHIGKRIFDEQFQEVEAVDFGSTLDNHSSRNINTSMNNVNFTQQLASLECTRDDKLSVPQQNFEMSALTDHQSKIFGDDLTAPSMGEMSGKIAVDFSAVQTLLEVKDDLDEIQKDLERVKSNVVCSGPFTGRKSLSEYIEVDLNATHVTIRNDDDDMSITDTIHSPKVQDVSKNCNSSIVGKKSNLSQDWVADKENIALNPYVTPKESTNFAINDENDKILVFDGKRLTVQSDKEADKILKNSKEEFKPNVSRDKKPQRKTIVLNVNDDLPNFVDDPMSTSSGMIGGMSFKHSVMYDDDDISITQPLASNINSMSAKNVTIVNDNEIGNISLTQAVNNVIIPSQTEKRRTIVDNCDISLTRALPAQIIGTDPDRLIPERRRTILYENDTGNISITQAIPANIIMNEPDINEKSKTVVFDNMEADISMTQVVSDNVIMAANNQEIGDISLTQAVNNVIIPSKSEKRRTIVDNCDISLTRALPAQIIGTDPDRLIPERRRTILYENDTGNISITQAIPANIIMNEMDINEKSKTVVFDKMEADISMTQVVSDNVIMAANNQEIGDISLTQAVNNVIIPSKSEKRRTIVDNCDISLTRALPAQIIGTDPDRLIPERRRTILYENDTGNISITQAIPANIFMNEPDINEKSKTVVFDQMEADISMTQVVSDNVIMAANKQSLLSEPQKRTNEGNISVTQALPVNIILPEIGDKTIAIDSKTISIENKTISIESSIAIDSKAVAFENKDIPIAPAVLVNVLIVNNATENKKPIMYDSEVQNTFDKQMKDVDSETTSHTSEAQDIPAVELSLPEKESTENVDDVIKIKNDVSAHSSILRSSPPLIQDKSKFTLNDKVTSSDSLIYIIRDVEGETQTDKADEKQKTNDVPRIEHSPLSLEYEEEDQGVTADLPKQINELKTAVNEKIISPSNRRYETVQSPEIENKSLKSDSDEKDVRKDPKKFRDANDTNELLEMLSDLTDRRYSSEPEKQEQKVDADEPRRLSVAPNRLSIVLSREDLLNNISMAQAALQRSIDTDESMEDTTSDTPVEEPTPPKKAVRVSNEVVKKLQFEDESNSETSIKCDLQDSLLKKTAFGESSYMQDAASKGKVIPSYLKDVSDGIKALMTDLVKPNADVIIPFQSNEDPKREASTCSTQIQANLIASSQIDLDTEVTSVTESVYELEKASMPSLNTDSKSPSIRSSLKCESQKSDLAELSFRPKRVSGSPTHDRVIVFDHNNPLNNVILTPIDFSEAHRYNPHKSSENISESQSSSSKDKSFEKPHTQFVGSCTVTRSLPSGDSVPDKLDAQSLQSNDSKPMSVDESISVRVSELKDTQVNTVIAMKANKELLEASSSLTLVDDAFARNALDVDEEMDTAQSNTTSKPNSPVKIIFQNDEQNISNKLDSDLTSVDGTEPEIKVKGKKRIYSPANREKQRYSALSYLDITPKPTTKMQKLSSSPNTYKAPDSNASLRISPKVGTNSEPRKLVAEKDSRTCDLDDKQSKEKKRSPRKSKSPKKPGTNVTVQQLITEYDIHPDIDQEALNKKIIEALSRSECSTAPDSVSETDGAENEAHSPDIVSSFTSSKNQNDMREACSLTTTETTSKRSVKIDWQPEVSETNTNMISECESSVNVVAKIDMLPFMGSHECEWEASGVDTWSFRLLHSRLRLIVRLAHRHDNATRTRVRADTPVLGVALETAHKDKKNPVATLCVTFAAEAMRYLIGRGCPTAGDVPSLLRRCAGVARVALKWGRAMHDARLHLAYTLDTDGGLALKVANIPLRSVWEVTMRLELIVTDARSVPWPRACGVRVARVVSDVHVTDEEVDRLLNALPRDWGHAPRAVWKIFRYLKNKTREDDLLGL